MPSGLKIRSRPLPSLSLSPINSRARAHICRRMKAPRVLPRGLESLASTRTTENDRPRYYVTCRVCLWYYFVCNVYILSFTLLYGPFEVRPRRWRSLSPNPIDYNHYGGSSMNLLSLPYGHKLRAHDLWPCPVRGCSFHFSAMGHLLRQASSQRSPRWYFV